MAGNNQDADSIDGLDLALALGSGSAEARALIEKQSRLIDAQETLARADLQHRGWQIVGERVGALIKGLTALVGILILLGVGSFLWSASRASGMVVDSFSVPPAMDRQGLTGAVVAGQLLDKVTAIESSTESARAPSSYENSWSDTDGVVVPYTGVSLGELRRDARAWLGSETHLKGEVVQLGGGRIAIAFRAGKASGRVEGNEAEFNAVLEQAAAGVFKATQPYRYSVWLQRQGGKVEEILPVLDQLSRSPVLKERLWAMHGLAMDAGTNMERLSIYHRALALRPDFLPAIGNLPFYALDAGHEEEAYHGFVRSGVAFSAGQDDYSPSHAAGYALKAKASAAQLKGNKLLVAEHLTRASDQSADAANTAQRPFEAASAWSQVHDFATARATLAAAGYLDPARRAEAESRAGKQESLRLLLAYAADDERLQAIELSALIAELQQLAALPGISPRERSAAQEVADSYRVPLALALTRSGRWQEARAILATMPADHDAALRARALIAAYAGEARRSDALFALASARTPSLPAARTMWAEALLRRGDTARAIEQARLANRTGPNWAEPLRLWGDALMAERNPKDAAAKYATAAKRAPRWGQLHMRWASALWRLGKRDEARAKLRAAAAMDLNDADRRHLTRMWAKATA